MSSEQRLNVSVEDGKYTVIMEADCRMHALRYGEPWQDLTGNNLVYGLAAEVEALRARLAEINSWIVCAGITTAEDMMQNAEHILSVSDIAKPYEAPTNG